MDHSSPAKQSTYPAPVPKSDIIGKRMNMYESHALNLLADLALNSFSSASMAYMNSGDSAPVSEPAPQEKVSNSDQGDAEEGLQKEGLQKEGLQKEGLQKEGLQKEGLQKEGLQKEGLQKEGLQNDCSPPSQSSTAIEEPGQTPDGVKSPSKVGSDASQVNSPTQHRTESSEKQASHKMLLAAAKAKARHNATSKISLEHSYSQLPRDDMPDKSSKEPNEKPLQSVSEPAATSPDNEVVVDQSSDYPFFPREFLLMTGDNGSLPLNKEPREVSKSQENFIITFKWEPKYDFDLDSKFTSDPLEKTINRALHGPWNPDLKEKVEDVKIILHMWVALFYSKPSQQLSSSSRKVVEHSNPAKYVSINTVHDPLYELLEAADADSRNDDESDLALSENMSRTGWHEMKEKDNGRQPANLGGASKKQTKVNLRDSEHEYSKHFSGAEETKRSSGSEKGFILLHEDSFSNEESAENYISVSPGPVSHAEASAHHDDGGLHLTGAEQATARSEGMHQEHVTSSTFDDTEFSPSNALTISPAAHVFHEEDGRSDDSHTVEEFPETESPLASPIQIMHASSENHETTLESTDDRDLTEARLQDVHVDSAVGLSNEDQLKSSRFGENQTNATIYKDKGQSPLEHLNYDCISEQASKSRIQSNDDNILTLESPKESRTSFALVRSEISSMEGDRQDQARTNADLLPESRKEVDSCSGSKVNDEKDSQVKEDNASSCTKEEIIMKRSEQISDGLEKCQKESSLLAKNDEVAEIWTACPGYNQENEHSYGSKVASCGKMGKLQLSSSSSDTSDVEAMETDNAGKPGPAHSEKTEEEKSHSNEEPDVVDASAEAPVAVFHQDNVRSPKDDGRQINAVAIQTTDDVAEINATVKTDEILPVHSQSPFPPGVLDADRDHSLTPVSADFRTKGTEAVDRSYLDSGEVENITEINKSEDLPDNTQTFRDQEVRSPISEEIVENTKAHFGEQSSFIDLECSKAADLESTGEKPSLLSSESSKVVNLESLGEKSSFLETSEAADLESIAEKLSVHGSESNDSSDLECISVFEKLSLKAITETYETPISTLAKKHELHIHDRESLSAENETTDHDPSVDLLNVQTDLSGSVGAGNSLEMLQAPHSEALNKATPLGAERTRPSECTQDSESATNQPVSKCVDVNVDQLLVESQSDSASDASVILSPGKPKISTQSMKNTIRKEILSKLKRICRGAGIGQHTSSNSEDEVVIVHEHPGKLQTGEQATQNDNKMEDMSEHEINTESLSESLSESTSKTQENQTAISEVLEETMEQEMEASIPSVPSPEVVVVVVGEAETPLSPDKVISPVHDEFTENVDQDPGQDPSDICCILNTGSISKEQYDRWSASSDDDVEFIRSYKEPIMHKTSNYFQKQSREFPTSPQEEHPSIPEPSHSRKTKHSKKHFGPNTSKRAEDEYHRYHRDTDYPSPRSRGSFIITKKLKDVGRTRDAIHKESFHAGRSDLDSLITNRRVVSSDLTQNTLDMERLRFVCKLKEGLRKSDVHVSEPPFQTMFDSKRIPGCSRSRTKGRNPLLITVQCTQRGRDYRGHASSSYSQAYYEDEPRKKPAYYSRTPRKVRTQRFSPSYHFNRLRFENTPEKPNSDISVIIKECTQSNHQRLSRVGLGSTALERTLACPVPEETDWQVRQTIDPASTKSRTVGTIITDLCSNLRTKLHSVARESAQKNCYAYLCKTNDDQDDEDDDGFFSLTKSLLIKDGYTPIDPQDFCEIEQAESKLLVIIRNEDVSSRIHKIPHLLQLRLLPNVRFAGVDTPEDLSESMYQELFQTGGFVVSDKAVLENISLGKLKDVLTTLEKMNRISAWKWLIHYGEYRKLKEDKRAESVSRTKIPLLKSYQHSNVIEILPYHRCDSRSTGLSSDLECLLSLQRQHIRSRLAVWLTVTPSTEAEEMEQNGILVYDVDTFIRRIQKVDAQLQPWS